MAEFKPGPVASGQLKRLALSWPQGDHLLITAPTQSGKTTLARKICEIRAHRPGGTHLVMVCKTRPDPTLERDYRGYVRWTKWKKRASIHESRILLWPETEGLTLRETKEKQREIFGECLDALGNSGKWTVQNDEGWYFTHKDLLNLGPEWAQLHAMGAASKLTLVTLAQRPSHIPLICYGSAQHAFVGRTREQADLNRLKELGGRSSAKELEGRISGLKRREFLWVPVGPDWEPEVIDLGK